MKLSPQIPLYSSLVLPSIAAAAPAPGSQNCPFNGPSFRPALDPLSTSAIQNAREKFPTILANALASGLLDNQTTSFSISVFAATGESGNQTLFTEHFLAPGHRDDGTVWSGRNESVKMGDESLYRIGSISKLVSLYALLVERGWQVLDKGIGEFVPELLESEDEDEEDLGELDRVRWEEVTVGDLAGHLAGLARDYGIFDLASDLNKTELEDIGLPILPDSESLPCGSTGNVCTYEQLVKALVKQRPVAHTGRMPAYSNEGYVLVGLVLEKVTGLSWGKAVEKIILERLGLNDTFALLPQKEEVKNAIVPGGDWESSGFGMDIGDESSAGSMYSSTSDLQTFLLSIIKSSLLPPHLTRRWLRPLSFTASASTFTGLAWEIFRVSVPLTFKSNTTRLSEIYTKAGDLGSYSTLVGISPDHDLGFTVLAAGEKPGDTRTLLGSLVAESWVAAAEEAAREEVAKKLVGTYRAPDSNNSFLTLSLDPENAGITLNYTYAGTTLTEMLKSVSSPSRVNASTSIDFQLFYMGLKSAAAGRNGTKRLGFRATFELLPYPEAQSRPPYDLAGCPTWLLATSLQLNGIGLDDFEILVDGEGNGREVVAKGFRQRLVRVA